MKKNHPNFQMTIVDFLAGETDEDTTQKIQHKIDTDKSFKREVEKIKLALIDGLQKEKFDDLVSEMVGFNGTLPEYKPNDSKFSSYEFKPIKPSLSTNYLSRVIIPIAIAASLAWFIVPHFLLDAPNSVDQVFAANLNVVKEKSEPPIIKGVKTKGDQDYDRFVDGYDSYLEEEYEKAISILEANLKNDVENEVSIRFLLGLSYIEIEKYESAVESFTSIGDKILDTEMRIVRPDNRDSYIEQIDLDWYTNFAILGTKDQKAGINKLMEIANDPDHPYYSKALSLLESITIK